MKHIFAILLTFFLFSPVSNAFNLGGVLDKANKALEEASQTLKTDNSNQEQQEKLRNEEKAKVDVYQEQQEKLRNEEKAKVDAYNKKRQAEEDARRKQRQAQADKTLKAEQERMDAYNKKRQAEEDAYNKEREEFAKRQANEKKELLSNINTLCDRLLNNQTIKKYANLNSSLIKLGSYSRTFDSQDGLIKSFVSKKNLRAYETHGEKIGYAVSRCAHNLMDKNKDLYYGYFGNNDRLERAINNAVIDATKNSQPQRTIDSDGNVVMLDPVKPTYRYFHNMYSEQGLISALLTGAPDSLLNLVGEELISTMETEVAALEKQKKEQDEKRQKALAKQKEIELYRSSPEGKLESLYSAYQGTEACYESRKGMAIVYVSSDQWKKLKRGFKAAQKILEKGVDADMVWEKVSKENKSFSQSMALGGYSKELKAICAIQTISLSSQLEVDSSSRP